MQEWMTAHFLAATGVALALVLVSGLLAVKARSFRRERDEFHLLLVSNFESCVSGLKEVLEHRRRICAQVIERIKDIPADRRAQAEMVSLRLVQGLRSIREALLEQINGKDRLSLNFAMYRDEMAACDEAMARLTDLIVHSVPDEEFERVQAEVGELRKSTEKEKSALNARLAKLGEEKSALEQRMESMTDAAELDRAHELLEKIGRDIDELEEGLFDSSGQMASDFDEQALEMMESRIEEMAEEEAQTEGDVLATVNPVERHGQGQRLRLQRLKRGVLDRVVRHSRAQSKVVELERKVETLNTAVAEANIDMEEVTRAGERTAIAREAMGVSQRKLKDLTQRIQQLESMEETSHRVRHELRNLGVINLELQRQVEEMMNSQVLYERSLRSLSKLKAEVEDRDERLHKAQDVIRNNEAEIRRLQRQLEKSQGLEATRTITIERKPVAVGDVKAREALESGDLSMVRHALREKLEENVELRTKVEGLQGELSQKQTQITALEGELDQLFHEYQKLFDRVPLT